MPEQESLDQEPEETPPSAEEAVYDEPVETEQSLLKQALQPTEEHYAPFSPQPDPPDIEKPEGESAADPEDLSFDPRWKLEFEGLLFLGFLTKRFTWAGHTFVIKSLSTDELLQVALVHQPYVGTLGEMKAYQSAAVAACLQSVDGKPLPIPVEIDGSLIDTRFDYVTKRYAPVIMDVIYNQYLELEQKVTHVLAAMGKASG